MAKGFPGKGFKNLYYAPITYNAGTNAVTFGTPVRITGAVMLGDAPVVNQEKLYADDTPMFNASQKGPRELNIEVGALTAADMVALLGVTQDGTTKEVSEAQTNYAPPVAIGWEEPLSNNETRFHWMLWVELAEDASEFASATDAPAFQTKKLKGSALPLPSNGKIRIFVDTNDQSSGKMTAANWFTATKLNAHAS